MMRIALALAFVALAACRPEPPPPDTGLAGYDPNQIAVRQSACTEDGGQWGTGGKTGAFVCLRPTSDANQSCSSAGDCEGMCLARSRSCAPITPLFGCNAVLTSTGATTTLCLD